MADPSSAASLPSPNNIHHGSQELMGDEDIHALLRGVLGDVVERSLQQPPGSSTGVSSESKAQARTERKRSREKQRRSDVNKQFAELTQALRRIEQEDPEETRDLPAYSPSNRVELMGRTVQLLLSLHENNKKRKIEIANLKEELKVAKKAGEEAAAKLKEGMMAPQNMGNNRVVMMVPMLIGGDGNPQPAMLPQHNPWMVPSAATAVQAPATSGNSSSQAAKAAPGAASAPAPAAAPAPATVAPWMAAHQMMPANMMSQMMPTMMSPWGMMPQQMMQQMTQPAQQQQPATNQTTSQKPEATAQQPKELGGNLAHCA